MSAGPPPPRTSSPGAGPLEPAAKPLELGDAPPGPNSGPRRSRPTEPDSASGKSRRARLERIYVITNGRSAPAADLDLVTLIVATDAAPPGLAPEQGTIMRLCRRPLSVAEISAHLRLPFSATAVLVADLLAAGLAVQRRPVRPASIDPELLEQVINGLRRL